MSQGQEPISAGPGTHFGWVLNLIWWEKEPILFSSGTYFDGAKNPLWEGQELNSVWSGSQISGIRHLLWQGQECTSAGSRNQLVGSGNFLFITYFLDAIILSARKWENNWSRDVYSLLKSWSLHVWQKCLTLLRVRAHFWPGLLFIVCSRNFSWVTPHIISWLIFDDDTLFWAK